MSGVEHYIGFDCGNSSIRTVLGSFDGKRLTTEVISQVPNMAIRAHTYDFWDILSIFKQMQLGFRSAVDRVGSIRSFGISTWGIDFSFLGSSGELVNNPLCYRNPLGARGLSSLSRVEQEQLFRLTGIQNHPMNSLFQLLGIREALPEYLRAASSLALIPDLLYYLFTGKLSSERTIASTTQLLDMRSGEYSNEVLQMFELPACLLPPLCGHTEVRGYLREDLLADLGLEGEIPAICVPSHDTASAVVAVPTDRQQFAFISSGTWSLIGTELPSPIIDETVAKQGFSNEGGVFDTITLLKNSTGMHILQNIKREMEAQSGKPISWERVIEISQEAPASAERYIFDPNDESLYNPERMTDAVGRLIGSSDIALILSASYRSLAYSYVHAIEQLEMITGTPYDTIHIIGGGSRNEHINQMTSDLSGKRVVAGPMEATSLGTIAVQILHAHPELSLSDIRQMISLSEDIKQYEPQS